MPYNPIEDEKKEFTLAEFIAVALEELSEYEKTWTEANDFHQQPHTWDEWWKAFHHYMSW